jgi:hypothetical protein
MWFNDDDIEKQQVNYLNSEVMRIFAKQYIDPMILAEAEEKEEEVETPCEEDEACDDNKEVLASQRHLVQKEIDSVIQKLATLSNEYGNEKDKYMIERAIAEIERVRQYGDADVI